MYPSLPKRTKITSLIKLKKRPSFNFLWFLPAIFLFSLSPGTTVKGQVHLPFRVEGLQHTGAVHFYAQAGELKLHIFKEDNKGGDPVNRILSAILTSPDGSVCDSAKLFGKTSRALQTKVKQAGIYTLLISMNSDQYNRAVTWGFESNVGKYMINSGTGHADRKREEPIVLNGADQPFGIFFKPTKKNFTVKASTLPDDAKEVKLYDGNGKLAYNSAVKENKAEIFVQGAAHDGIWELRVPQQRGTVTIEGITHNWDKNEKPLPVWTTSRKAFFELGNYHWLLSPRRFARNVQAGDTGEIRFSLFNNSKASMPLQVSLTDLPAGGKFSVRPQQVKISPGASQSVTVHYTLGSGLQDGKHDFHLLATDTLSGKQAYSLVELRSGTEKAVTLPIQLKLFEHNQFQFAYEPDYPRNSQFYFDAQNRPWVVTDKGLMVLIDATWETIQLSQEKGDIDYPTSTIGTDTQGYVYTIVTINESPYLLRVNSRDRRPELVALPHGGTYKMETFMGGKISQYPPVVLRYLRDSTKKSVSFWAKIHSLELFPTSLVANKLQVGTPILISNNCVGTSDHSGITNSVAADGNKLHLIWGETSDPDKKDPGVPTYTATYDRTSGTLSQPIFLTYSPPVNDAHNMSALLVDSRGTQHVIIGAHGRPFQYLTCPAGTTDWSKALPMSELGQTYVGAALDAQDGIHLFCRTWRRGEDFPGIFDAALYYQHKGKNQSWEEQRPFALPALPGYGIYYHRLTVDRTGRLYLSMDYWPTWSAYRESYRDANVSRKQGKNRVVFTSTDGTDWQIVSTKSLKSQIQE